jgi:hypothetical protein
MYTVQNFKTKKALKEAVAAGKQIETYQPGGMFEAPKNGMIALEGPHYPEPHRWYASAEIKNGIIVPGTVK